MNAVAEQLSANCPSGSLVIRPFVPEDAESWDKYVESHPDGTFFHLAGWREVLTTAFGHSCHYLVAQEDGNVAGVLPLGRIRHWLLGDALISTPFCVYGGALGKDERVVAALENAACDLAQELNVDYLELRNRVRRRSDWPCKSLYVTFRKRLNSETEQNMLAIPKKQRAMVRKGIKAGLQSEISASVDELYACYSESVRNLGTPVFSKKYFRRLMSVFGDRCRVLVVRSDEATFAAVMSFYFRDEVLPYYGGGSFKARKVAANDFMYWELIRRSVEECLKIFDFGRSKVGSGSYRFKKHWGFDPKPLYYEYFLVRARSMPDISPLNPKYRLMISIWKRLPLWLSNRLGPIVSGYLG